MRILAIDFGTVRVGLALSDELRLLVTPLAVLQNSSTLVREIVEIVAENNVGTVVLGMPYGPDGGESEATERVRTFEKKLRPALPCPLVEWDERFTSREARARMVGAGVRRKRRERRGTTDMWAAAIILQDYLEANHR